METTGRIVSPGIAHHLVLRANNLRRLFSYPREYAHFVSLLASALLQTRCRLHAAVLLPEHIHLMVTPAGAHHFGHFVKHVAQRYAQHRNWRRGQTGRLFASEYPCVPLPTDDHVARAIAYAELEPVRAGLVDHPSEYRWSTYGLHAEAPRCSIPSAVWTPTPWYLSLGSTVLARRLRYMTWVETFQREGAQPESFVVPDLRVAHASLAHRDSVRRPDRSSAR